MAPRRLQFFLSFFVGIGLGTATSLGFRATAYLLFLGLTLALISRRRAIERRVFLWPVALSSLALSLGLGVALWSRTPVNPELAQAVGSEVVVRGWVADEPDNRETSTRLILAPDTGAERVLLVTSKYPEYRYGDELRVSGKLERPENFETEAGRNFDYVNYLAKDDLYYLMSRPVIEKVGEREGVWVSTRGALFAFKRRFVEQIGQILPEPHSALLAGIAIGAKNAFPSLWQERFRIAGVSHIIVLSGYNITIVAESVSKALRWLPALAGTLGGVLSVALFTLATGASSTAVRSAIMASIALFGRSTGRVYSSLDALFLAAFFMILFSPKILLYDLSFQLSFLATLGVITGPTLIRPWLTWLPERLGLQEMTVTTLSAQALVLPWILYKMGNLSLIALPANLLILSFIPLTMFSGSLAALLSFASSYLALPFTYLSYLILAYDLLVVRLAAAIPHAAIDLKYFPLPLVIVIYIFYFWRYHLAHVRLAQSSLVPTSPPSRA